MKYFLMIGLVGALSSCSWLKEKLDGDKPDVPNKPVPACVQQTNPKNPGIPCKVGDWWAPEHGKCSATEAGCKAK
jgi:hypothetical protein